MRRGRCESFDEDFQIGKVRIVRETSVPHSSAVKAPELGSELGKRARPERWPSFRFGPPRGRGALRARLPSRLAHSPSPIARLRMQRNQTLPADNAREARSAAPIVG